jgi:hypothetical protein
MFISRNDESISTLTYLIENRKKGQSEEVLPYFWRATSINNIFFVGSRDPAVTLNVEGKL